MSQIHAVMREMFPQVDHSLMSKNFEDLGLDSFELMTFRALLEKKLSHSISDTHWVSFRCFQDIENHLEGHSSQSINAVSQANQGQRQIKINMPQMAAGGLSESWLFKELGDLHWAMIAQSLGKNSDAILDEFGKRLYATFVRIRFESRGHLKTISENDQLNLSNELSRFGKGLFYSQADLIFKKTSMKAQLLSTFSLRESTSNKTLLKAEPRLPDKYLVPELSEPPEFSQSYRNMRKGQSQTVVLAGEGFQVSDQILYSQEHLLNPYHELNGVNLLYFAAYPLIHEFYEREFIHQNREEYQVKRDWALESSSLAKDVFYFANCDIGDVIIFKLNEAKRVGSSKIKTASSLYRKSDGELLARIFSVKEIHG